MAQVGFKSISQVKYDSLESKNNNIFYRTEENIYLGEKKLNNEEIAALNLENGEGAAALQQKLNREVFTVANENINNNVDVVRNEAGNIVSGAIGDYSSIFGGSAQAKGKRSQASGSNTVALGGYSHAEGNETFAKGYNSHSEGLLTSALGDNSHAEGAMTSAIGVQSHAEGISTQANGENSHAEGGETTAIGNNSHAEGAHTIAEGDYSHSEGAYSLAKGEHSHAEGIGTVANGKIQHVQGKYNVEDDYTDGRYAHIVGNGESGAQRSNAHTLDWDGNAWYAGDVYVGGISQDDENVVKLVKESELAPIGRGIGENADTALQQKLNRTEFTVANEKINESTDVDKNENGSIISGAIGAYSSIFGGSAQAKGKRSQASGSNTVALGGYSHAEGNETFAGGTNSHAEGLLTSAIGNNSHSEGAETEALGNFSHSEGAYSVASGEAAHAEGINTVAQGEAAHAEGSGSQAIGSVSHVEGVGNIAEADAVAAHVEGSQNRATKPFAHAEGNYTEAKNYSTHAEGYKTIASSINQHVQGALNIEDAQNHYAHILGSGTEIEEDGATYTHRRNVHTVDWEGSAWFKGDIFVGGEEVAEISEDGTTMTTTYIQPKRVAYKEELDQVASDITAGHEASVQDLSGRIDNVSNNVNNLSKNLVGVKDTSKSTEFPGEKFNNAIEASGFYAHAEGHETKATGNWSHAEGYSTEATGGSSHAEGEDTQATNLGSHSEGMSTKAIAAGAHAEGARTQANADASHAEGIGTVAKGQYQHVQGRWNVEDLSNKYAHIVGNGYENNPANAHTVDWFGNAWYKGDIFVGGTSQDNGSKVLTELDTYGEQDKVRLNLTLSDFTIKDGMYFYEFSPAISPNFEGKNVKITVETTSSTTEYFVENGNLNYVPMPEVENIFGLMPIDDTFNILSGVSINDFVSGNLTYSDNNTIVLLSIDGIKNIKIESYNNIKTMPQRYIEDIEHINDVPVVIYDVTTYEELTKLFKQSSYSSFDSELEIKRAWADDPKFEIYLKDSNNNLLGIYSHTEKVGLALGRQTATYPSFKFVGMDGSIYGFGMSDNLDFEYIKSWYKEEAEAPMSSISLENSVGVNSLQQTLNREVFTVANVNINNNVDIVRDENGNIKSGAIGDYSAIFGGSAQAKGKRSMASGSNTVALGGYSHAEGNETFAGGTNSHAEGLLTSALGSNSHAEGDSTVAEGNISHAEGANTLAKGVASHVEGVGTVAASEAQHVQGAYNEEDAEGRYVHIVGNGNLEAHHNAHTLEWGGNAWYAGDVYVGGNNQDEGKRLLTSEDIYGKVGKVTTSVDSNQLSPILIGDKQCYAYDYGTSISAEFEGYNMNVVVQFNDGHEEVYSKSEGNLMHDVTAGADSTDMIQVWYTSEISEGQTGLQVFSGTSSESILSAINSGTDVVFEEKCTVIVDEDLKNTISSILIESYNSINMIPQEYVEGLQESIESLQESIDKVESTVETDLIDVGLEKTSSSLKNVTHTPEFPLWANTHNNQLVENSTGVEKDDNGNIKVGAFGKQSVMLNGRSQASGEGSLAEGGLNVALGKHSHAEGEFTFSKGNISHTEGLLTSALGDNSHAEGTITVAEGYSSHSEGESTKAIGSQSHAEGLGTIAAGLVQHVQGKYNIEDTENKYAHIVGNGSADAPSNAHTVDWDGNAWYKGNLYIGGTSQNDGKKVLTKDDLPIEKGSGINSVQMIGTKATGDYSYSEGYANLQNSSLEASGTGAHAGGYSTAPSGSPWNGKILASGAGSFATGYSSGAIIEATQQGSVSTGYANSITGKISATEKGSFAHGYADATEIKAAGKGSFAVGYGNIKAIGEGAHAEGYGSKNKPNEAIGTGSHAEGRETKASGNYSHAEGYYTEAEGEASHAEGFMTTARGKYSHVEGKHNKIDTEDRYLHIAGNGSSNAPSNAHTLDWNGNSWYQGDVYVGGTSQDDGKKLATEEYVDGVKDSIQLRDSSTGVVYTIRINNGTLELTPNN